jgi:hypothetical protein
MVKNIAKKSTLLFLVFLIDAGYATCAFGVDEGRQRPLRDGLLLKGVDGELITKDSNDIWFFAPDKDMADGHGRILAKTAIKLLPSATLQMIIADANERADKHYRLWGRITRYKACNFIFPMYFLPLTKTQQSQHEKSVETTSINTVEEPNRDESGRAVESDEQLDIPKEILDKLSDKTYLKREQVNNDARSKRWEKQDTKHEPRATGHESRDFILVDRVGFISKSNKWFVFTNDAFGCGVPETPFRLLPCQVLEFAELRQSVQPDPIRFKVAGIVTEFNGKKYLLLQRAIRTYSHGNFGG